MMPKSALDIGAVLLLVLPGFLAYSFALARRADPAGRSPLWQLAEILKYSVYVHLVGVVLVFGVSWLLDLLLEVENHLEELPGTGPQEFLSSYFAEGVLLFTLYPLYVVVGATLMGAYDLPSRTESSIISKARFYPDGDPEDEQVLDAVDGGGTVLLNTSEVSSIEVYYEAPEETS